MKLFYATLTALCLASAMASAQPQAPAPRTADGHPDLSGLWTGNAGAGGGGSPFGDQVRNSLGAVGIAPSILVTRDDNIENFERFSKLFRIKRLALTEDWAEREYLLAVRTQEVLPTVVKRFVEV